MFSFKTFGNNGVPTLMLRSSLEMDNFDVDGQIKLFNWAPEQLLNDEFEKYF